MRILAVDFGFKRIGIAVGDAEVGLPALRPQMEASGSLKKDAARLSDLARKEDAEMVVVGLPVEPGGEEGRMARICRNLAAHIEEGGLGVALVDETLSSVAAEDAMFAAGLKASQRKKARDSEAAAQIFERYIRETKA